MKIGATADLHGYLPEVPADIDLLLIAGDVGFQSTTFMESFQGWSNTVGEFADWLSATPCPVIGVAGNHDFGLQGDEGEALARSLDWTYLLDESTEFNGYVIHGSPWTPTYGQWAFMQDDIPLAAKWGMIPNDVDILITHGPPQGVMDIGHGGVHAGSRTLASRLEQIDPLLHVFGHIHGSRGVVKDKTPAPLTKITANVAYVDEDYLPIGIMTFEL